MGLLDALSSDDAKLGIALLSASGYSPTPMSFGQRLGGALGQFNAERTDSAQRALKTKLLQSQIDENASQAQLRAAQAAQEARKQATQEAWFQRLQRGGGGSSPALSGGPGGGVVQGLTADDVLGARLAGLPDFTPLWQATRPEPVEVAPGLWQDKKTMKLGTNQAAIDARTRDRTEQSDINMRGDFVDVEDASGRKWKVPKSSLVGGGGGPAPAVRPAGPGFNSPGLAGGSTSAAASGQLEILSSELNSANRELAVALRSGDAAAVQRAQSDIAGLQREIARLPGGRSVSQVQPAQPTGVAPPVAGAIPSGMSRAEADAADVEKSGALKRQEAKIEADSKRAALAPKEAASRADSIAKADRIMGSIDDAAKAVGLGTAGPGGSLLRGVPGTSARDLSGTLDTIKANLGFAELQAMRDASPTGGALGAIAVQELVALQSTVASLDQGQSPDQLAKNLQKIKHHYGKWKETVERAQAQADGREAPPTNAQKSFKEFGYSTQADAIKDAQNAMMRNPGARAEILRRLDAMGVKMPDGKTGAW